jgi:NRPS condensation-like uncharacterized protein
VLDTDTMISMLPDSMQDKGGKMIKACKDVSEYRHAARHKACTALFSQNKRNREVICQNEPMQNKHCRAESIRKYNLPFAIGRCFPRQSLSNGPRF